MPNGEDNLISLDNHYPNPQTGLTDTDVQNRILKGEYNLCASDETDSLGKIIRENVCTYFNLIFLIIAVSLCLVGSFRDLTFLPVIAANTLIGIVQAWRSKKALDRIHLLNTPKILTVRNGQKVELTPEELVRDDIIVLRSGSQIPADARVCEGHVQVNESLLTGEADEIPKDPGDELLSGSFVISGSCRARLEKVGDSSYVNTLSRNARKSQKGEQSEMIRSLDRLVKIVGIILVPIAAILLYQHRVSFGLSLKTSVTSTAGACIGMIPEGLYLLASVALAVSVMRLASDRVLVHNMKSIESLARADVLCVDKTGTITENVMRFSRMIPLPGMPEGMETAEGEAAGGSVGTTGGGTIPETPATEEVEAAGERLNTEEVEAAGERLNTEEVKAAGELTEIGENIGKDTFGEAAEAAKSAEPGEISESVKTVESGEAEETGETAGSAENPETGEDLEIREIERSEGNKGNTGSAQTEEHTEFLPEDEEYLKGLLSDFAASQKNDTSTMRAIREAFPRKRSRKAEQVIPFSPTNKYSACTFDGRHYVLGAPEFLLADTMTRWNEWITPWIEKGYRTLLFGESPVRPEGPLTVPVRPMCLILLSNPVRAHAKETFGYFAQQGVSLRVISGDNPATAAEAAAQAGIEGAGRYIDVSALSDEALADVCDRYTVFGRVTPAQKRVLVRALKAKGHTVAMTGDGVNDVLALHDADCSIAMASGSDAAANASQMVLLDSDFAKMPSVVSEGRRVVNNIERTASLFLVKNIFSLLMAVFSIIFGIKYPLSPTNVSLVGMFTIGIPAFLLALENNTDPIRGHFMSNVLYRAVPGGLTDFAVLSTMVIYGGEFGIASDEISTACTVLLAVVGLMILHLVASPMTGFHRFLWWMMAIGLAGSIRFFPGLFAISSMSRRCVMLLVLFAVVTEPVLHFLRMLVARFWKT